MAYGTNILPSLPPSEFARHFVDGHYTAPTRWLFFNYIPRNNFYEKPYPQPKTQGCDWDWDNYWCWEDPISPKRWQYRNFTDRRSDVGWTINQVHFDATLTDRPGEIEMQMGNGHACILRLTLSILTVRAGRKRRRILRGDCIRVTTVSRNARPQYVRRRRPGEFFWKWTCKFWKMKKELSCGKYDSHFGHRIDCDTGLRAIGKS